MAQIHALNGLVPWIDMGMAASGLPGQMEQYLLNGFIGWHIWLHGSFCATRFRAVILMGRILMSVTGVI
jgi:hypothetical protein